MGGSLSLCQLRRFRPYLICSKHTLPTASQACSLRLSGRSSSGPLSLRQGGAISASLRAALSRYPVRSNSRNWVGPYPFNRRFRPPCQLQAYVIPVLSFVMGGGSVKKSHILGIRVRQVYCIGISFSTSIAIFTRLISFGYIWITGTALVHSLYIDDQFWLWLWRFGIILCKWVKICHANLFFFAIQ